ncbi:MAG TPA: hypothetical protein VFH08_14690, partial [Chitinophagaceae bacterium]|nr:hypothetical protein [Chitinophagaceae bacterium]
MRKIFLFIAMLLCGKLSAQQLRELVFDNLNPITIKELKLEEKSFPVSLPLFSIEVNKLKVNSNDGFFNLLSDHSLHMLQEPDEKFKDGYKISFILTNNGRTPVIISNIVPFGANENHHYISGKALADTSRAFFYQPGKDPIGIIVPHNSNDLNFTAVELGEGKTLFGL